jgi:hypothetical protein
VRTVSSLRWVPQGFDALAPGGAAGAPLGVDVAGAELVVVLLELDPVAALATP